MSTHNVGRKSSIWQGLIELLLRGGHQEADDPRSRSWARAVKAYAELPTAYQPFFEGLEPHQRDPFPYTVLTPTFKGGHGRAETERLLCIVDGCVHVVDLVDGQLRTRIYSPAGVSYLEQASILLHSWITIHGQIQDGTFCSTTVRFSSVGDFLMAPFVQTLRPAVSPDEPGELEAERSRFNYLAGTHFKFMSYARSSIRPGDKVLQILLQPQIRQELLQLFSISLSRLVSPAHLSILTCSELILIRDDESQRWIRGSAHGAIWTYIPREKIIGVALAPAEDGRQRLSIAVAGGRRIEALFEANQEPQVGKLLSELRSRPVP